MSKHLFYSIRGSGVKKCSNVEIKMQLRLIGNSMTREDGRSIGIRINTKFDKGGDYTYMFKKGRVL